MEEESKILEYGFNKHKSDASILRISRDANTQEILNFSLVFK